MRGARPDARDDGYDPCREVVCNTMDNRRSYLEAARMNRNVAESIVATTPLLKSVTKVDLLDEGFSDDTKYVLWEGTEPKYLLRLSAAELAARREIDFGILRMLAAAGIRCSTPHLFGLTVGGEACYSLLGFIPGGSAEKELPSLTADQQYEVGLDAGRELRKLHAFKHPDQRRDYAERRIQKYERYTEAARDMGITFPHQADVHRYIKQRYSELGKYSVGLQHDDYHTANLIVRDGEFVGVVDFNRCDWGDPIEDFCKAPWFSAPVSLSFVRGQINGYLAGGRVQAFWARYNLFVALSLLSSLVWVQRTFPENRPLFLERIEEIMNTHDFNNGRPPVWYEEGVE